MKKTIVIIFCLVVGLGFAIPEPREVVVPKVSPRSIKVVEDGVGINAKVSNYPLENDQTIPHAALVMLEPEGVKDGYPLWDIRYPAEFEHYQEENGKLFLAMPESDVGVTLTIIPKDFPKSPPRRIRSVLKAAKKKDPPPDEDDDEEKTEPKPDPKPNANIGAVVVIEQRDKLDEAARNIRMSDAWRKLSTTKDIVKKASWYDVDNPEASEYVAAAREAGLPAILLFDEKGKFVKAFPLPKSEKDLLELVK